MMHKARCIKLALLAACLLTLPLPAAAGGRISKSSKQVIRYAPGVQTASDFSATALSSTSLLWTWSTGSFTGIDGFHLHSSSTAAVISLSSSTTFYIDSGLGANQAYTRWLTLYEGATEGSDSPHIEKYTYAMPPLTIAISSDATVDPLTDAVPVPLPWAKRTDTIFSTSAYAEIPQTYWFPNPVYASAYVIECSTDGGNTYVRNRTFFVPWETFPVLSNKHYIIRMGAVNGDNELTPGIYSATRTFTTPPLTPDFTAVAVSSYSIEWRWNKDAYAGTGITGFDVYLSTMVTDGEMPEAPYIGIVANSLNANTSYWVEVYTDSGAFLSANSRHTRWLKAVGYLDSEPSQAFRKYTYGVAPGSATVVWIDPAPYWTVHLQADAITLNWPTPGISTATFGDNWRQGIASQFVIDYSTTAGFAVAVSSTITAPPPQTISSLTDNTKYDLRVGAINGDGEQTPANAANPFAYSQRYRVITRPAIPTNYACASWTDTAMHCTWSSATYTNASYISGYDLGDLHYRPDGTMYWSPLDFLAGVTNTSYDIDYLLTNSTHTITIWVDQTDPDWIAGNPHFDASPKEWEFYYYNYGSHGQNSDGYTYATPPNDVAFSTRAPHGLSLRWLEPQVPATQYRVERSTTLGSGGPWVFVSSVAGNSYYDSGLDVSPDGLLPFTTYTYRIGAVNLLGFQTLNMSSATQGHRKDYSFAESTMTVHGAPAFYAVATGTSSIRWWWSESYPGIISYAISTGTEAIKISGLAPGTTFYDEVGISSANARMTRRLRSVTAYDGAGDYAEESVSTLVNAPAALTVTSTGAYTMTLGWPASEGPRYKVDRSTDMLNWSTVRTWSDVLVSTWFTDTGLRYATTYYYAVSAYNDDGAVSLSSAVTTGVTLPLPSIYIPVSVAVSTTVTAPLPGGGQVSVFLPAGTPDGYFWLSTGAASAPADISKTALDDANARLTETIMAPGTIVELHLFDVFGNISTATLPSQARLTFTYPDADADGLLDGTTIQTSTLRLYNLDTSALNWNRVQGSTINSGTKSVYADIPHFSFYALAGDSAAVEFMGTALSTASIQWKWPLLAGVDGYYLYSSSTPARITLSSAANSHTDTALQVNKPYTRWLTSFTGAAESQASQNVTRYTHALPPATFTYEDVTSTGAFLRWNYSTATAYAIEASTDNGATFVRLRDAFVPWQAVDLRSNSVYLVRLGAVNHDNVMTPGLYSSTRQFTTYPLAPVMTAVAISSYAIQWQWSTGPFTGTGITGYHVYMASPTTDGELPVDTDIELLMHTSLGANTSYWIETYTDVITTTTLYAAANSRHTRWVRAYGHLQSMARNPVRKYTYATSADICTVTYYDPDLVTHLQENSVTLSWLTGLSSTTLNGIASSYVVEYSTAGDFTTAIGTVAAGGPPALVDGLTSNTKYDLIVRPVNGDGEITPENAANPYARTGFEKVMTQPDPPYNFAAVPRTDTMIGFSWSTMTYSNTTYIDGYSISAYSYRNEQLLHSTTTIAYGIGLTTFTADYMLTNSTNICSIQTHQVDPTWNQAPNFWRYKHLGSDYLYAEGSTFATPPNDVSFSTVGARFVNLWWNEPLVPATKYRVEVSSTPGEGGPWTFIADVTGSTFTHTGLTPSTTYTYRIGAINRVGLLTTGLADYTDGNRRDYSFVRSTLTKHVGPTLTGTALSSTSINWTWVDTAAGVTAYNVYTASNGFLTSLPGANTGYVEIGLMGANTSYTRLVRSVASDGEGDYGEATVFTLANHPAALTVTSSGTNSIGLSWAPNGSTRYGLYRSRDGVNWASLKNWASAFTSAAYSDNGLLYNTSYYYAVVGYNGDGLVSPSSSTLVNRTLPLPSTYTVLYATAGAQTVTAPMAGLGLVTVTLPAGLPDGYLLLSTNAATAPVEVPKASVDAATAKLSGVVLIPGSVVELRLFDSSGTLLTSNLPSPARIKLGYLDVNSDDLVDGVTPAADVRTLRIFTLNTSALTWDKLSNSVLDRSAQNVYADIPHFSIYMLGSVTSAAGPLADAFAYPNPYRPGSAGQFGQSAYGDGIVFEGLPAYAKIRVFSLAGAEVADFDDADGDGRALWDARNKSGAKAASGMYFYVITPRSGGGKKTGRVSIIR